MAVSEGARRLIELAQRCHESAGHPGLAGNCKVRWCAENAEDLRSIVRTELLLDAIRSNA